MKILQTYKLIIVNVFFASFIHVLSFQPSIPLFKLTQMTSLEVEEYISVNQKELGCVPIIIPIGATEQHGPTGLCGTDILTAEAVANEVASLNKCLLGPSLSIGMSIHHLGFPGSISLRPSTLASLICDTIHSLRESSNITHFMFINGHGGNLMALEYAKYLFMQVRTFSIYILLCINFS